MLSGGLQIQNTNGPPCDFSNWNTSLPLGAWTSTEATTYCKLAVWLFTSTKSKLKSKPKPTFCHYACNIIAVISPLTSAVFLGENLFVDSNVLASRIVGSL